MTPDDLREAVALALRSHRERPDDELTALVLHIVRKALREPSEGMIHQGGAASDHPSVFMGGPSYGGKTKADRIWRAMLAASPLGGGHG